MTTALPSLSPASAAPSPAPARRAARRLSGLDLARALAVLAMFTVHLGAPFTPEPLQEAVRTASHGRSSALFALLAGIALAMMSGRAQIPSGALLATARRRIAVRAGCLVAIGLALIWLDTPVAIIIAHYGGFLLLALPFLGTAPRRLYAVAALWALAGPQLSYLARSLLEGLAPDGWAHAALFSTGAAPFLLTGMFPAVSFLPYVLAGMALGRLDLADGRVRTRMAAWGAVLAAAGYGGARLALWALASPAEAARVGAHTYFHGAVPLEGPAWLLTSVPHSGTTFEVAGSAGVGMAVVAACLAAADRVPRAVAPLAAVGAMSLTVYVAHVLGIWGVRAAGWGQAPLLAEAFAAAALAGAWAWRRRFGKGPLERLVAAVARRGGDALGGVPFSRRGPGVRAG
ncbi:heparan-alpha-glucosaminide N-acetyltransferase domain-containing protein [Nocardiopsis chromatogenes]|uniref:heparan-alpha-glucosaminide N-acetyltransferase domain-containing protein n=1 Tax=Nocardiopsis chromatogenes TaxID=280239 RepID=UPI000345F7A8|nr:heparan-alpha-glucosaminide N-acetyltransferase domain-containing protein [Nocardiopsis chromatogenes]